MNRLIDLVAALAFVFTLDACQSNPTSAPLGGSEAQNHPHSLPNSGTATPAGSSDIGGQTGSAAIRRSP